MSSALVPFTQQMSLADAFVKSGLFGLKDSSQALALMALCEAEGIHPASAIRDYHIIQGKPAMKSDAMLARFQRAGGSVSWTRYTDQGVTGVFTHPQGGTITIEWTPERAQQAKINNDMWKKYPRNMMRSRCISEAVRALYPGIATGIYTVEEVQDMPPADVKDMGNVVMVDYPDPWSAELRKDAADAAAEGTQAYSNWWKAQPPEFRKLAVSTNVHADMKLMAGEVSIDPAE